PSSATLAKSEGVFARLTLSQSSSRTTSVVPTAGASPARRIPPIQEMLSRRASVATGRNRGGGCWALPHCLSFLRPLHQVLRRRNRLVGRLLPALDQVDRDRVRVRVAVRIDRERAQDAIRDLRLEQLGGHVRT